MRAGTIPYRTLNAMAANCSGALPIERRNGNQRLSPCNERMNGEVDTTAVREQETEAAYNVAEIYAFRGETDA